MQGEFDADPEVQVSIVAVNEKGYGTQANYELTGAQGTLPVLQDLEVDGEIVWDLWEVVYRDVIILNECGEKVGTYNLTSNFRKDTCGDLIFLLGSSYISLITLLVILIQFSCNLHASYLYLIC